MKNSLQNIYNQLATEKWGLTERQFSKEYLGKCETYFAYLKSTGNEPSADALLKLWGNLNKERQSYKASMDQMYSGPQKQILTDWATLYSKLIDEVFEAIQDRAVAVE